MSIIDTDTDNELLLLQLNQMTEEAQAAPGSFRSQMMSKVRGYRNQLDKLKKDMVR